MPNPFITYEVVSADTWIMPMQNHVFVPSAFIRIKDKATRLQLPTSSEVFDVPSRSTPVVVLAAAHAIRGEIDGLITDEDAVGLEQYLARLEYLRVNQHKYEIWVAQPGLLLHPVTFPSGFPTLDKVDGVLAYALNAPFVVTA